MKLYDTKQSQIKAILVTVDNLEEVESLCNGSIKGTKLPRHCRRIEFYNKLHDSYLEVEIDEYLCLGNLYGDFYPCKKEVFEKKYYVNNGGKK